MKPRTAKHLKRVAGIRSFRFICLSEEFPRRANSIINDFIIIGHISWAVALRSGTYHFCMNEYTLKMFMLFSFEVVAFTVDANYLLLFYCPLVSLKHDSITYFVLFHFFVWFSFLRVKLIFVRNAVGSTSLWASWNLQGHYCVRQGPNAVPNKPSDIKWYEAIGLIYSIKAK